MPYELTGPGRHRYKVTARTLDHWRTDGRGFSSGRVLDAQERAYFRRTAEAKKPTPTELVYRELLEKRKRESNG
ncbi:hypothetical protein SEA_LIBERTYBELL_41 [Streptomyces phage LibertyBell]|nr:hypothetical protein SEA_LIBERTYBELL_41 [Streptomyces phage LibertyBell]